MSGEIEAAGALATAGMAAKAIDGGGSHGDGHGGACRNCETPLEGAYCYQCGQPAHISRTLGEVAHDFLHSVLHFDTRAWRTLPLLVGRPGTLTHDYIHGHRARYISPLALFLFTVFLMFFVFSVVGVDTKDAVILDKPITAQTVTDPSKAREMLTRARADSVAADKALVEAQAKAAVVEAEGKPGSGGVIAGLTVGPQIRAERAKEKVVALEAAVVRTEAAAADRAKQLSEASAELSTAQKEAPAAAVVLDAAKGAVDREAARTATPAPAETPKTQSGVILEDRPLVDAASDKRWQDQVREAAESGELNINMGNAKLNEKVRHAALNPDLALYKLTQTTYKWSFLLVPISLPFIALLFLWRRGVTLFDHVVFSLYSLSFMSLLFILIALFARAGDWAAPIMGSLAALVPPVHMFFHLGGTYKLGWWSALWRTTFLLIFVLIAATLFAVSVLYLGLAI